MSIFLNVTQFFLYSQIKTVHAVYQCYVSGSTLTDKNYLL